MLGAPTLNTMGPETSAPLRSTGGDVIYFGIAGLAVLLSIIAFAVAVYRRDANPFDLDPDERGDA
jgi:hypothetical protein